MSRDKIEHILGNGNEYFSGAEIWDQLAKAGFVIVKKKPTKKMLASGQASLDYTPIMHCEQQAKKVWDEMVFVATS